MGILEKKIFNLLEGVAKEQHCNLAYLQIVQKDSSAVLQIFLEKDIRSLGVENTDNGTSVTIQDCSTFSKKASIIMDMNEVLNTPYTLEVSSLGINRPLFKKEDYEKFKGSKISLRTKIAVDMGIDGIIDKRKGFKGILQGLEGDSVVIQDTNEHIHKISLSNIEKSNLSILESLIKAPRGKNVKGK